MSEKKLFPEPVSLRKLIGPSFVILVLGLGSGEVILWPYLTANYGLGIACGAILGITFQYFLNMEIERKTLVALCEERIPMFQWITTYFLSFTLLFTLLVAIPSNNLLVESLLKGVFSTSVIIIIILLKQLDKLEHHYYSDNV